MQPKTRDRKALNRLNTWADIYNENTTLRKHKRLLGQEVETDDGLEWRVKWGQRALSVFALLLLIDISSGCRTATDCRYCIWCSCVLCFFIIYYKNVSFVIVKRLLREVNVVVIILFTIFNWSNRYLHLSDPAINRDSLFNMREFLHIYGRRKRVKSRVFVIIIGSLHVMINVNNIYGSYFLRVGSR